MSQNMTRDSELIASERLREIAAYQPLDFAITHTELTGMARELLALREAADFISRLSTAPAGDVVLVPREPTEAMIVAGHREIDWCRNDQNTHRPGHPSQTEGGGSSCGDDVRDAYRAMIAAAQEVKP